MIDTSGERDRWLPAGLLAVPGKVERERPVAFGVQMRPHTIPSSVCAAEAMQQDNALGHAAILVSAPTANRPPR
jgi:hypothetical protein